MDTVADFSVRVWQLVRGVETTVDRKPRHAAVVCAEGACSRDGGVNAIGVIRIFDDGVEAHAARARLPEIPLDVTKTGEFLPGLSAVGRTKERGVLDTGVDRVGIGV